jgi:biotin carboxyl carrier protein
LKDHGTEAAGAAVDQVKSTMPGTIHKVNVTKGAAVKKGDILCSLMSMKNEYIFKAERDGVVEAVRVKPDQAVPKDYVMVKLEPLA